MHGLIVTDSRIQSTKLAAIAHVDPAGVGLGLALDSMLVLAFPNVDLD